MHFSDYNWLINPAQCIKHNIDLFNLWFTNKNDEHFVLKLFNKISNSLTVSNLLESEAMGYFLNTPLIYYGEAKKQRSKETKKCGSISPAECFSSNGISLVSLSLHMQYYYLWANLRQTTHQHSLYRLYGTCKLFPLPWILHFHSNLHMIGYIDWI